MSFNHFVWYLIVNIFACFFSVQVVRDISQGCVFLWKLLWSKVTDISVWFPIYFWELAFTWLLWSIFDIILFKAVLFVVGFFNPFYTLIIELNDFHLLTYLCYILKTLVCTLIEIKTKVWDILFSFFWGGEGGKGVYLVVWDFIVSVFNPFTADYTRCDEELVCYLYWCLLLETIDWPLNVFMVLWFSLCCLIDMYFMCKLFNLPCEVCIASQDR